jgi:hypothetical protein
MQRITAMKNGEFEHREKHAHPEGRRGQDLMVRVSKVGGGTVGRAYDGFWLYRVSYIGSQTVLMEGDDLNTNTPKTHSQAAGLVLDFLADHLAER